jgi:lipoyl(octanoyl) transferase
VKRLERKAGQQLFLETNADAPKVKPKHLVRKFAAYFYAMNKTVALQDLGLKDYKAAWDYQEQLFSEIVDMKIRNRREERQDVTPNYLLFVEHPHVYTLGKSGDASNMLLSEKQLEAKGATFYKINRGGDITYHGPGQIVGYPILDLENFFTDIHKYLRLLEEAIILTLAEYGLKSARSEGETGVWLDVGTPFARKICAMGVRASRWVTMHGFALNVNADLGYFDNIIPCGIRGKAVTSLNVELGVGKVDETEVKVKILKHFSHLFGCTVVRRFENSDPVI